MSSTRFQNQKDNHQGGQADGDVEEFGEVDFGKDWEHHAHWGTVAVHGALAIGESWKKGFARGAHPLKSTANCSDGLPWTD